MKTNNIIQDKSFSFALRIIELYKYLTTTKKEFVLSKQILRSGTSVGANVEEGIGAQTKKDFITKISIAHKEARESNYWLKLLHTAKYISSPQFGSLNRDCEEIVKITGKIQKTSRDNLYDQFLI
jgi:four helix bundle protein